MPKPPDSGRSIRQFGAYVSAVPVAHSRPMDQPQVPIATPVFFSAATPRSASFKAYAGPVAAFNIAFGSIFGGLGCLLTLILLYLGGPFWDDWIISAYGVPTLVTVESVEETGQRASGASLFDITFTY